ncbi:MAG: energy transducer TonB [Terriglobales bacterium]
MLFAKMRHGVVEIAAGEERCYVEPPALQRIHLLWTFRNFRRLSASVLSHRQQQILEHLVEISQQRAGERVDPDLVIGRAEFSTYLKHNSAALSKVQSRSDRTSVGQRQRKLRPSDALVLEESKKADAFVAKISPSLHRATKLLSATAAKRPRRRTVLALAFASLALCAAVALRIRIDQHRSSALPMNAISSTSALPTGNKVPPSVSGNAAPQSQVGPAILAVSMRKDSGKNLGTGSESGLKGASVARSGRNSSVSVQRRPETARASVLLAPRRVIYPVLPISGQSGEANRQILVRAIINIQGTVAEVLVPGQDPRVTAAVISAVKQWQYRPYLLNGQPAEVETLMMFTVLGQDTISVRFLPPGKTMATP